MPRELITRSPSPRPSPAEPATVDAPRRCVRPADPAVHVAGGPAEIGPHLRDVVGRAESAGFDSAVGDGPLPSDPARWGRRGTTCSRAGPRSPTSRPAPTRSASARSSAASRTATSRTSARSSPRSTCCLAGGSPAGSVWRGSRTSTCVRLAFPTAAIATRCWRMRCSCSRALGTGRQAVRGSRARVPDTTCYPRPLQERVPILVGGSGRAAHAAPRRRSTPTPATCSASPTVRRKVGVLRRHCADVGRDPTQSPCRTCRPCSSATTRHTCGGSSRRARPPSVSAERFARAVNAGTVDQHVGRIERFVEAGVDQIIVSLADLGDAGAVDRYGNIISACRELGW